ncbi:AAA family ATPase [Amycolatopsis roodepoortensis]|uniref:UvrD-helicase domain-containing protein n=1 Tax=Amycolatopsis roodepoortensis TaxID=700274 RepID=UPI00214BB137|nr:UvrD-helicase domain-containing protein [Amycolatopsis roodepoortensis]UUV29647.1 AAA family ATPase [Amycolatopsis roodepoortensis]
MDEDLTGLDLKIPQGARDPRVRTARVTDNHRAVLFAAGSKEDAYYLLVAIRPHDEAYEYAGKVTLRLNPANGVAEVLRETTALPEQPWSKPAASHDDRPFLLPYSTSELEDLGILPSLAEQATVVRDEDALQALCLEAPEWQACALLDLAYGESLDAVRRSYTHEGGVAERLPFDSNDPEQLRDSLNRSASKMEFVVVEDDDHLSRMVAGDFATWRTFLHPTQRDLAERHRKGSFRIAGGAGTGKTVVAMHRAVHLARCNPKSRVLLTTFTVTLAAQLEDNLRALADEDVLKRIDVVGIDRLARQIVARTTGRDITVVLGEDEERLWEEATAAVQDLSPSDRAIFTPRFLAAEHKQVILGEEDATQQTYLNAIRRGRKVKIDRIQKIRLWRIVEEFVHRLSVDKKTTFSLIVAEAAAIAKSDRLPQANRYDHVVVDEGQDLSPAHWRLLRAVVPVGPDDMFISEDAHQRIYGAQVVLSRLGIETRGRSQRLTLNYRTTREVVGFATRILEGEAFMDLDEDDESTRMYRSLLTGPRPEPLPANSWEAARDHAVRVVEKWVAETSENSLSSLAVLTPDWYVSDTMVRAMKKAGIPAMVTRNDSPMDPRRVQVATVHRAKGIEFDRCLVISANADKYPPRKVLAKSAPSEHPAIELESRCLLYVACTRPRRQLVVVWHGEPSKFLPTDVATAAQGDESTS